MAAEPDEIRTQIEVTRGELAANVDRLADRTSPGRIMQRGKDRVGYRVQSIRERVMGAPGTAGRSFQDVAGRAADSTAEAAGTAADAVREAPQRVAEQARGNPLAAGMVAFGVGLLAATLIPKTEVEQEAARRLADSDLAEQIRQPLAESASELGQEMKEDVKESASEVGRTAKRAAKNTAQDAREATSQARSS